MKMTDCIDRLKNLREHCEDMIDEEDPECVWKDDVEALTIAIRTLEDGMRLRS